VDQNTVTDSHCTAGTASLRDWPSRSEPSTAQTVPALRPGAGLILALLLSLGLWDAIWLAASSLAQAF